MGDKTETSTENKEASGTSTLDALRIMQAPLQEFKPSPISDKEKLLTLLDRVPGLVHLLESENMSTLVLLQWGVTTGNLPAAPSLAGLSVLPYIGVGIDALKFLQVPLIYLNSAIIGQKPPINLSNNAQMLYSGALLGLTITALSLPLTAPFIFVAATALVFASSVFTLGRLLYLRRQHIRAVDELGKDISLCTAELHDIQKNAAALQAQLATAQSVEDTEALTNRIRSLHKEFEDKKQLVQDFHDAKHLHEQKIKLMDTKAIAGKVISITLSALALAGFVVALFFPPTGLAMVLAAAVTGLALTIAHFAPPLFKKIGNWIKGKFGKEASTAEATETDTLQNTVEEEAKLDDSTALISNQLNLSLHSLLREDEKRDAIDASLHANIIANNAEGVLDLFKMIVTNYPHDDLSRFADKDFQKGIQLLQQAILTKADNATQELLTKHEPLQQVFTSHGITFFPHPKEEEDTANKNEVVNRDMTKLD